MTMVTRATFAVLAIGLVAAAALWIGTRRQRDAVGAQIARLTATPAVHAPGMMFDQRAFDSLPPPVARYLRMALPPGLAIEEVRISQTGELRTDPAGDGWMSFEAEHIVVPPAIGFLWNARVKIAPLLHVRVRDAFVDGVGSGHVSFLSALPVGGVTGGLEVNSGSLHRYLAEAVWYPTALLPGPHLQWTASDATAALATLTVDTLSVSLEFRFADSGEVTGIYTPARWGKFRDEYRQVPWEGHFRDYQTRDGVRVPGYGEVGWYLGDEWRSVWQGTVSAYKIRVRE